MKIIVIPYRDAYFWNEFGTSVRDLQMIEILSQKFEVIIINRPVSIYERFYNKKKKNSKVQRLKNSIQFIDKTSFDLVGPLFGRKWTRTCYNSILKKELDKLEKSEEKYVVLDFSPFAMWGFKSQKAIYWYDLIDNFTKHNRFSAKEKKLVKSKYEFVSENYDLVTGVSVGAISEINSSSKVVLSNGVYSSNHDISELNHISELDYVYDFGFVGFITDKLDINFINDLSKKYSIVIYGKFFNEYIKSQLDPKIKVMGQFKYEDLSKIMRTFKIGLLPYLPNKSHDESPLKMYEYFKNSKPCITSINYEIKSEYYFNYKDIPYLELIDKIDEFKKISGSEKVKNEIQEEWIFSNKIHNVISKLGM